MFTSSGLIETLKAALWRQGAEVSWMEEHVGIGDGQQEAGGV